MSYHSPSLRKARAGTQAKRGPGGRNCSRGHGRALRTDLLIASCPSSFLSLPGPPDRRWHCQQRDSHPTSIHNQERTTLTPWSLIWWKHFLSWKSLSQSGSTLGHIGEGKWHRWCRAPLYLVLPSLPPSFAHSPPLLPSFTLAFPPFPLLT